MHLNLLFLAVLAILLASSSATLFKARSLVNRDVSRKLHRKLHACDGNLDLGNSEVYTDIAYGAYFFDLEAQNEMIAVNAITVKTKRVSFDPNYYWRGDMSLHVHSEENSKAMEKANSSNGWNLVDEKHDIYNTLTFENNVDGTSSYRFEFDYPFYIQPGETRAIVIHTTNWKHMMKHVIGGSVWTSRTTSNHNMRVDVEDSKLKLYSGWLWQDSGAGVLNFPASSTRGYSRSMMLDVHYSTCAADALCVGVSCGNGICSGGECICADHFSGTNCEVDDLCESVSCVNGDCSAGECVCHGPQFSGTLCEIVDLCHGVSCVNGDCSDSDGICYCRGPQFSGTLCEDEDLCYGVSCVNGDCSDSDGICNCNGGWVGARCEIEDPCLGVSCQHDGTCLSFSDASWYCTCTTGHAGETCELNVGDCIDTNSLQGHYEHSRSIYGPGVYFFDLEASGEMVVVDAITLRDYSMLSGWLDMYLYSVPNVGQQTARTSAGGWMKIAGYDDLNLLDTTLSHDGSTYEEARLDGFPAIEIKPQETRAVMFHFRWRLYGTAGVITQEDNKLKVNSGWGRSLSSYSRENYSTLFGAQSGDAKSLMIDVHYKSGCIFDCNITPCHNGGTCQLDGACQCPGGFLGNDCQLEDFCYHDPCENDGICQPTDGSCVCNTGWTGDTCGCDHTKLEGSSDVETNSEDGVYFFDLEARDEMIIVDSITLRSSFRFNGFVDLYLHSSLNAKALENVDSADGWNKIWSNSQVGDIATCLEPDPNDCDFFGWYALLLDGFTPFEILPGETRALMINTDSILKVTRIGGSLPVQSSHDTVLEVVEADGKLKVYSGWGFPKLRVQENQENPFCNYEHGYHLKAMMDVHYSDGCVFPSDCNNFPCQNDSTCQDGSCVCELGYTGTYCQTAADVTGPCAGISCGNGVCQSSDDSSSWFCSCTLGWMGTRCDEEDLCHGVFCENGTCNPSDGTCDCELGWYGSTCDQEDRCHEHDVTCENGQECWKPTGLCKCPDGWVGNYCEEEDLCHGTTCPAGQSCRYFDGSCACPYGFSGESCGSDDSCAVTLEGKNYDDDPVLSGVYFFDLEATNEMVTVEGITLRSLNTRLRGDVDVYVHSGYNTKAMDYYRNEIGWERIASVKRIQDFSENGEAYNGIYPSQILLGGFQPFQILPHNTRAVMLHFRNISALRGRKHGTFYEDDHELPVEDEDGKLIVYRGGFHSGYDDPFNNPYMVGTLPACEIDRENACFTPNCCQRYSIFSYTLNLDIHYDTCQANLEACPNQPRSLFGSRFSGWLWSMSCYHAWFFDLEAKDDLVTVDGFRFYPKTDGVLDVFVRHAVPSKSHGHMEHAGDWIKIHSQAFSGTDVCDEMSYQAVNGPTPGPTPGPSRRTEWEHDYEDIITTQVDNNCTMEDNPTARVVTGFQGIVIPRLQSRAVLFHYSGTIYYKDGTNSIETDEHKHPVHALPVWREDDYLKLSSFWSNQNDPFGRGGQASSLNHTGMKDPAGFGVDYTTSLSTCGSCDLSPCYNDAVCNEANEMFSCTCPNGTVEPSCFEDLCLTQNDCDANAECITDSSDGTLICSCPAGYRGDGRTCELFSDEDLCSSTPDLEKFNICIEAVEEAGLDLQDATWDWKHLLAEAKERWEEIITSGVGEVHHDLMGYPEWEDFEYQVPGVVSGLYIYAELKNIDGRGNSTGNAQVDYMRRDCLPGKPCGTNRGLPYAGHMALDYADIDFSTDFGRASLLSTVIHEIAHLLGFGGSWADYGLVNTAYDENGTVVGWEYTGTHGCREWVDMSGCTDPSSPPLEHEGGGGTRGLHWNERTDVHNQTIIDYGFNEEIMTGYGGIGFSPVSRLTIAALEDLGYDVDYTKADSFTSPQCSLNRRLGHPKRKLQHEQLESHLEAQRRAFELGLEEMRGRKCRNGVNVLNVMPKDYTVVASDGSIHSVSVDPCDVQCDESDTMEGCEVGLGTPNDGSSIQLESDDVLVNNAGTT